MINLKTFPVPQESAGVDFYKVVPDSDSMETPPALFKAISKYFGGFGIDAAATIDNTKAYLCYVNGLINDWVSPHHAGDNVWCNPPYSQPAIWVEKAHKEVHTRRTTSLAVLLLRFDPSTKLWRDYAHKAQTIYLLTERRIRFIGRWYKPDGTLTKNTVSYCPHMLMEFRR